MAFADTGSFAAAAERERIAQPALWKQVRQLERELGVLAFEKAGRRVRLTADGDRVVMRARDILARASDLEALGAAMRDGIAGVVRVTSLGPPIPQLLGRAVVTFQAQRPDVRVVMEESTGADRRPAHGDARTFVDISATADCAIGSEIPDECDGVGLDQVRVVLVPAENSPLRRRRRVDVSELRDRPIVTAGQASMSRTHFESACARAGFRPHIVAASENPMSVVALGRSGVGVAVIADDAAGNPPDGQPWPILTADGQPFTAVVAMFWPADRRRSTAVNAWIDHVKRMAAGQA